MGFALFCCRQRLTPALKRDTLKRLSGGQAIARETVRKVRASQGRVPANGRWRQLQGKCNRKKPPHAQAWSKDGKARQELTRVLVTDARCKPHPMQDPNRSDTAARRASKEIATTVWQHAAKIDDRPTTELGLRPHRQLPIIYEKRRRRFFYNLFSERGCE